ncbi:hypothetical protein HZA96_04175 [Candidatus Woesearchaeota archaeon]|nr:hypothetical protein [Candidatus Woesearchaeota archaeon]
MYCLDTYALWEIQFANEKFVKFLKEDFVITEWTLIEFYKTLLREYNQQTADYWSRRLLPHCKNISIEIALKSVLYQHENKKENMSLFDCIGYIYSQENNLVFVTGDKAFRNRAKVLFIQK